jgi:hypothetical protein
MCYLRRKSIKNVEVGGKATGSVPLYICIREMARNLDPELLLFRLRFSVCFPSPFWKMASSSFSHLPTRRHLV